MLSLSIRIPGGRARLVALGLTLGIGLGSGLWIPQAQAQLYRWVDDNGEVHYTDNVPASKAKQGHTKLTEEGIRTDTLAPAPSEEEIERAKEEERRKAEEARRLAEKKAADERLLKTYRTLDDLEMARDGKIAAIDALIKVKRDTVRAELARLIALDAEMRKMRKAGDPIPPETRQAFTESGQRIRDGYAAILQKAEQKKDIYAEFAQTIAHYKRIRTPSAVTLLETQTAEDLELPSLVSCNDREQCGRYWQRALEYVRSSTEPEEEIVGPGLLVGFRPDEREELRFALSWTQQSADQPVLLFLDLQCKNKRTASLACTSDEALSIRDGLRASVPD